MDRHLTRKGALAVTNDIDRIANLIAGERQPDGSYVGGQFEALGIPAKIAMDFAWKCDVISDAIEKRAVANDAMHGVKKEAAPEFDAQPGQNETGGSAEPTGEQPSWDPNAIADNVGGPWKSDADEAAYMGGNFDQRENHQLRDKQQAGDVPKVDAPSRTASFAKLAKLMKANGHEELRGLSDRMKACVAKLEASKAEGVAPLISGAKMQIAALDSLADQMIKLDSTGEGSPELLIAADNVQTAVSEILPHLEMVEASSADQTSPTALLEHEQLLADGMIAKLVSLAGKITSDAMKGMKGSSDKEASAKRAEDDDKSDDDSEDDDKSDDDSEDDSEDDDSEDDSEDDDSKGKKASSYDLYAN